MSTVVRAVVRQAGRTLTTGIALGGLVVTSLALDGACERPIRRTVTANATQPVASTVANVATKHRAGRRWPGHPGRRVISYHVRSGDTASRIAVRFHAWTAELLAINHKTSSSFWYVGEKVKVPVVTARAGHHADKKKHHPAKKHPRHKAKKKKSKPHHTSHSSRARVRDEVKRVAREHGVNPHMAL